MFKYLITINVEFYSTICSYNRFSFKILETKRKTVLIVSKKIKCNGLKKYMIYLYSTTLK